MQQYVRFVENKEMRIGFCGEAIVRSNKKVTDFDEEGNDLYPENPLTVRFIFKHIKANKKFRVQLDSAAIEELIKPIKFTMGEFLNTVLHEPDRILHLVKNEFTVFRDSPTFDEKGNWISARDSEPYNREYYDEHPMGDKIQFAYYSEDAKDRNIRYDLFVDVVRDDTVGW
jgi:hypothetical protein